MTKEKAIETLIASAICYSPIFSCDECPAYKRELCDCDLPTNEKVEQAIRVLRGCMEQCVPVEVVYCKDRQYRSSGNCEHPRHHGVLPSAYPFDFCNYGVNKHGS